MYNEVDDWPRRNPHRHQAKRFDAGNLHTQDQTLGKAFSPAFARRFNIGPQHQPPFQAPEYPIKELPALPSRANALIRRLTALKSSIAHLTTVVEPLTLTKRSAITEGHLYDVQQEASNVRYAFHELEAQMYEVEVLLDEIKKEKEREKEREQEKDAGRGRNVRWYEKTRERAGFAWY
jgi:hypothetical protein